MMESLKRILIGPGDAATEWRTLGQTRVIVALLLVSIAATRTKFVRGEWS